MVCRPESDVEKDFPILSTVFEDGRRLVYLDSAATTQKPKSVIERITHFYESENANVSRGAHKLGAIATSEYAKARETVANFIGAKPEELIFTSGTTESINAVAYGWGEENVHPSDEIVVLVSEHHSDFIPWQQLARKCGADFKIVDVKPDGTVDLNEFKKAVTSRTKIVAFAHVTNTFGVIHPVREMIEIAHSKGAITVIDGAQSVPHISTNVKEIGMDFLAFSGHKMLGPMGIGGLYISKRRVNEMRPFFTGGGMIDNVKDNSTIFANPPEEYEAGTPNVAGAIGLAAAVEYLEKVGMDCILDNDRNLLEYAYKKLDEFEGLTLYGTRDFEKRLGVLSFNIKGVHPHDVATILDAHGVAIRSGHHCAQPLMKHLGIFYTARASFYVYNKREDVDILVDAIKDVKERFS